MFAIKGKYWRGYSEEMQLLEGETVVADIPSYLLTQDPVQATREKITQWLDEVVQRKGYDSIVSCASYASSTNDQFRTEARAAIAWRDAVYAQGYQILTDTPTGVETPDDVMALLPQPEAFGWPAA